MEVIKSWMEDNVLKVEGWLATNHPDTEHDITEPEAFLDAANDYFSLNAPLSVVHEKKTLPGGHVQKAAIIRNGIVLATFDHPIDKGEFSSIPNEGNGVWARAIINEPVAIRSVQKANMAGFSFIAKADKYEELPTGGYRFLHYSSWSESTVAPYPINQKATFKTVQKGNTTTMDPKEVEAQIAKAVAAALEQKELEVQKAQAEAETARIKTENEKHVQKIAELEVAVQKALAEASRGTGIGSGSRIGDVPELTFEDNPLEYLVQKAKKDKGHDNFTIEEKDFAVTIFKSLVTPSID